MHGSRDKRDAGASADDAARARLAHETRPCAEPKRPPHSLHTYANVLGSPMSSSRRAQPHDVASVVRGGTRPRTASPTTGGGTRGPSFHNEGPSYGIALMALCVWRTLVEQHVATRQRAGCLPNGPGIANCVSGGPMGGEPQGLLRACSGLLFCCLLRSRHCFLPLRARRLAFFPSSRAYRAAVARSSVCPKMNKGHRRVSATVPLG